MYTYRRREMKLTERQEKILDFVKQKSPVSGEAIAQELGLSRSALRTDFSILIKGGFLESKKNYGYMYQEKQQKNRVGQAMGLPKAVDSKTSVYETIVYMFENDIGSVFVTEEEEVLVGVVSRKDLLKAALGNKKLESLPVHMIMTRMPNLIYVEEKDEIALAVEKIIRHEIDSLPVVRLENEHCYLVGRFSKTSIAKLYLESLR